MSKPVKWMISLFLTYVVEFVNLAEQSKFGIEKDPSVNVDFLQDGSLYNVCWELRDDHAEFDVFGSSGIKDMVKVLEDVMMPGAHMHVFCYDL